MNHQPRLSLELLHLPVQVSALQELRRRPCVGLELLYLPAPHGAFLPHALQLVLHHLQLRLEHAPHNVRPAQQRPVALYADPRKHLSAVLALDHALVLV